MNRAQEFAYMKGDSMETIVAGLAFPEGLRWHGGALYFSDMHSHQVLRWKNGRLEILAHIPGKPSGLGFIGDDVMLVASQHDRSVWRVNLAEPTSPPVLHADVSAIATWHVNDMITDTVGNAYVGNFGNGAPPGEPIQAASLAKVSVDGTVTSAADNLYFPNGMAFSHDEQVLYVAETRSEPGRITAFDVHKDGSLTGRRVVIEFADEWPDGIAIDRNGDLWVASPFSDEVLRVSVQGEVLERLKVAAPYAVGIGGSAGSDLFVASADTWVPEDAAVSRSGRIVLVADAVK